MPNARDTWTVSVIDPFDRATLTHIGFTVGDNTAIRVRRDITIIIRDNNTWYASYWRANTYCEGTADSMLAAYKDAKRTLHERMIELGVSNAAQLAF